MKEVVDVTPSPSNLDLSHISCTHSSAPSPGAGICIDMSSAQIVIIADLSISGDPSIYDRYLHTHTTHSVINKNQQLWEDPAYGVPEIDEFFQISSLPSTQIVQMNTFLPSKPVSITLTSPSSNCCDDKLQCTSIYNAHFFGDQTIRRIYLPDPPSQHL